MGFSNDWEKLYKDNTHQSIWPWSDLISLVYRNKSKVSGTTVLELGCGAGANIKLFQALEFSYHGLDGSKTTIESLKKRFPELASNLFVGDFTKELPVKNCDIIVDRGSVTHNSLSDIEKTISLVYENLARGGIFICIDLFSTAHFEYKNGSPSTDIFTRENYTEGQFANTGKVHFTNEEMIRKLFSKFEILHLEHKTRDRIIPQSGLFASFDFIARKT